MATEGLTEDSSARWRVARPVRRMVGRGGKVVGNEERWRRTICRCSTAMLRRERWREDADEEERVWYVAIERDIESRSRTRAVVVNVKGREGK